MPRSSFLHPLLLSTAFYWNCASIRVEVLTSDNLETCNWFHCHGLLLVQVLLEADAETGLDVQDIHQGNANEGGKGKRLKAVKGTRNDETEVVSGPGSAVSDGTPVLRIS